jgi:hypothetical protein
MICCVDSCYNYINTKQDTNTKDTNFVSFQEDGKYESRKQWLNKWLRNVSDLLGP